MVSFPGHCPKDHIVGLRRGCQDAPRVLSITGTYVTYGARRFRGALHTACPRNREPTIRFICGNFRRSTAVVDLVNRCHGVKCHCSSVTILCENRFRSVSLRTTLAGSHVPFQVASNINVCRAIRTGSLVSLFHVVAGSTSHLTFREFFRVCPNVNTTAVAGL